MRDHQGRYTHRLTPRDWRLYGRLTAGPCKVSAYAPGPARKALRKRLTKLLRCGLVVRAGSGAEETWSAKRSRVAGSLLVQARPTDTGL